MRRICYVLQECSAHTHFSYNCAFVDHIRDVMDVWLVTEKGARRNCAQKQVSCQRFRFPALRLIENFIMLFRIRLRGYSDFYVHYSFLSALNAACIARFCGGRVFYWNAGLPWLYRRPFFREWIERAAYRAITFLVTGTEGLKQEYAKHYDIPLRKIKVMPNWIDVQKVKSQKLKIKINELKRQLCIPEKAKVLLFVHRLSKRKGAHYLLEIMNRLRDENVVLLVVGDGPERDSLELKIEKWGLANKTRFLGWTAQHEVTKYFSIADIFIMPSEEEGFPHALLEALAAKVPFVSFRRSEE